jgi:Protein of unknown function (DUF3048) N-terminal domain/Protein of unknown function (DUF3048) C-terminal domain
VRRAAVLLAFALALAACSGSGDDEPTTDAGPSTTIARDETPIEATGRPEPTAQAEASSTWPLTGEPLDDADLAQRPALVAKIDNAPAARPQSGINEADMVVEEIVEGGLTRLLAVFHSHDAERLGPIRSARSTDIPFLASLEQPLFAWSGANAEFAQAIRDQDVVDVGVEVALSAYDRDPDRSPPSDLFTSTAALYDFAGDAGVAPRALLRYREDPSVVPLVARDVLGVDIDFGSTIVSFTWDPDRGVWLREQDGEPFVDADGEQVAPANVILQYVDYRDTGLVDGNGVPVPEAVLFGQRDAFLLVDGRLIQGVWSRTTPEGPTEYRLVDGTPVGFAPGATWILLPMFGQVSVNEDLEAQQPGN